jgi:hypothetical protein
MANPNSLKQQVDDAVFLKERFGIAPRKAGDLVARDGADPDEIRAASEQQGAQDPLGDAPQPAEPASEHTADTDEQRLKPVLHKRNDRVGGA